jgi:glycosyltransferase involved in cell wall biosynthesis
MRVYFDHDFPFVLSHGGFQTQIEQTGNGLRTHGVQVEFLKWWEENQPADLLHFFGITHLAYLHQARIKGIPVVMTTIFSETCNRSDARLARQGFATQLLLRMPFGNGIKNQLSWLTFQRCSCMVVGLEAERKVLETVYRVPRERTAVVPLGLSEPFLTAGPGRREEDHLIYTGTITEQKGCVELAELALQAQVPVLFVGKPYSSADPYWKRFTALVDGKWVRHEPHVSGETEMIRKLQAARGFVIMSRYENWCLSAHEAAACGLPLLLPDLKWAHERFGDQASYLRGNPSLQAKQLRAFYDSCADAPPPKVRLYSWDEVGAQMRGVYERVLSNSR